MPEENKGPDSVSPQPEGAKTPAETAVPQKPEVTAAPPAAEVKPAAAAAKQAAPPAKPADPLRLRPRSQPLLPRPKPPAAPAKPAGPVPEPWESEWVTQLRQQYGSGILEASRYLGQTYLVVDQSILPEILRRMRDDEGFDYCVDITAVHYPKREQQFDIVYVLYSFPKNERTRVKTQNQRWRACSVGGLDLGDGQLAGARSLRHVRHCV